MLPLRERLSKLKGLAGPVARCCKTSGHGTSRHFAASQQSRPFQREADINFGWSHNLIL
jgi:hypothetical protein